MNLRYTIIVLGFLFSLPIISQTTTCSTDLIELKIQDHNIGTLEWEKSNDGINWEKIKNEHNTSYIFETTEPAYYRSVNKFPNCEPIYSSVTLVQRPPIAIAGENRSINGTSLFLAANTIIGSTGTWSVIEGTGGTFDDPTNPSTRFTGVSGNYTLEWKLENACGNSTDTIDITILDNQYNSNIVIVDDTDILLSTESQLENGEYTITFNDPVPTINNSTLLIGMTGEGYLRRVNSVTQDNNTFTMLTEQGKLEDVFTEGGFELGTVFEIDEVLTNGRTNNYNRLNQKPTRAEILSNTNLQRGIHFYLENESVESLNNNVSLTRNSNTEDVPPSFNFSMNNTLFDQNGVKVDLNGSLEFTPNVFVDYTRSTVFNSRKFTLGLDNATLENDFSLNLTATAQAEIPEEPFNLFSYTRTVLFIIGGVPLTVDVKIDFDGKTSAEAFANLNFTHQYTNTITTNAGINYEDQTWSNYYNTSTVSTLNTNLTIEGGLVQNLEIGPKLTFKVYSIVGPYIDFKLTEDFSLCAFSENLEPIKWQGDLDIGAKVTAGVRADILQTELFDFSKTWTKKGIYKQVFPHKLEVISGNHQEYSESSPLINPIRVRVISSRGTPVPGVAVFFNADPETPGIVTNQSVFTDLDGYAETDWVPESDGIARLIVTVKDCNDNNIADSPFVFQATEVQGIDCSETTLNASNILENNLLKPIAHLGLPPYTYSTDNTNFSTTIPEISPVDGQDYTFYIKDSNGCLAVTSFFSEPFDCDDSDLELDISIFGSNILAEGFGGTPPYQYALNSETEFSSSNVFNNLDANSYQVSVKDANDCVITESITVTNSNDALGAYFIIEESEFLSYLPIKFVNLSNNAVSYSWDFGDGSSSTFENPIHTYNSNGNYNVSLTVTDNLGEISSYSQEIIIDDLSADLVFNGNITLLTQDEVDQFGSNGYKVINGNLNIGELTNDGVYNIFNLSPLNSLVNIQGNLHIGATQLTNLNGLEDIVQIDGDFRFYGNTNLINMSGMTNLKEISGDFRIAFNFQQSSFIGLENLTSVRGNIDFSANQELMTLNGLNGLSNVNGELMIRNNSSLISMSGINSLSQVGMDFIIRGNSSLENLQGLESINNIHGTLHIQSNDLLVSLNGINNLNSVGGNLYIGTHNQYSFWPNENLSDFCALTNLINNGNLTGSYNVANNSYNPTQQDIIDGNCEFINIFNGDVVLTTQQEVDDFGANNYNEISGGLKISGSNVTSLMSLSSLEIVHGNVELQSMPMLQNLNGLNNVSTISGKLQIIVLTGLQEINALSNLNSLGQDVNGTSLIISVCTSLSNIDGLSGLQIIPGYVELSDSLGISNLSGLSNLTSANRFVLWGNNLISSLNGLENLVSLDNGIEISGNSILNDLCSIRPLIQNGNFSGNYTVSGNAYNPTQQDIIDGNCSQ